MIRLILFILILTIPDNQADFHTLISGSNIEKIECELIKGRENETNATIYYKETHVKRLKDIQSEGDIIHVSIDNKINFNFGYMVENGEEYFSMELTNKASTIVAHRDVTDEGILTLDYDGYIYVAECELK